MSEIYKPGDRVPATGIYKTVHGQQHAPAHYVTALYGDTFPTCWSAQTASDLSLLYPLFMSRPIPSSIASSLGPAGRKGAGLCCE